MDTVSMPRKGEYSMDIKAFLEKYPRLRLTPLPTPLTYMKNLSEYLGGVNIYVKRDDIGSLAFGGNKTRKLEYIMAKALEENSDTIVTLGGVQSNWVRQTIAAAKALGMDAVAVLEGEKPDVIQGNLMLDMLMGASLIYMPGISQEDEDKEIASEFPITGPIAEKLRAEGKRPFLAPLGGATPTGHLGYINMVSELKDQLNDIHIAADRIVIGTGTGGTHAGIQLGLRMAEMDTKLTGISVSFHTRPKEQEIAEMCNLAAEEYGITERFTSDDISVNYDYVGAGYGAVTEGAVNAVKLAARLEGLIMCHTYAGKALSGLIDLVRRGEIKKGETVVFVHTGGGTADFEHPELYL